MSSSSAVQEASTPIYDDGEWVAIEADNYDNFSQDDAEDDLEDDLDALEDYPEDDSYAATEVLSDEEEENESEGNVDVQDQPEGSASSGKRNKQPTGRRSKRFRQHWLEK